MAAMVEAYNSGIYPSGIFPLIFEVRNYRPSRLLTLLRMPLLIPWYFVSYLVQFALIVMAPLGWFVVVVTGRYPRPLFSFTASLLRWTANYFAFFYLLSDRYALFGFTDDPAS